MTPIKNNLVPIGISLAISGAIGALTVYGLGGYGWTVFIFTPFLIGFLPAFLSGRNRGQTKKDAFSISFLTLFFAYALMLIFTMEGVICLAMASPLVGLFTAAGSFLAYKINREKQLNGNNTFLIALISSLLFLSFDYVNESEQIIPIKTKQIINAPIEKVWDEVVTFSPIPEPAEWIFKTGIAYPTHATIDGEGVGAIRYCNFTTGSFIEPITIWQKPTLLAFDVTQIPSPMKELNPFGETHPPHLDGYFRSQKGQFQLTQLNKNKTLIEGTTWYEVDLFPSFYWQLWTNFIVQKIHLRVLNHIKKTTETN